jgi:hypothetical protein
MRKLMVRIKTRKSRPKPFSWEIYETDERGAPSGMALAKSQELFASESEAKDAGSVALAIFVRPATQQSSQ